MPHPLLPGPIQAEYRRLGHWADVTLAEVVRQQALSDPHRPAVVGEHPLSYGELWDASSRLAGSLAADGIVPGEFLLAVLSNCWQGVVLAVAASIAGVALSPLSARVSPTLALNIFDQVGARGLVLQANLLERDEWRAALRSMRGRLAGRPAMLQGEASAAGELATVEAAIRGGAPLEPRVPDPGRPSLILSTGGTTGRPKSVLHCDNTLLYAAREYGRATDFRRDDVVVAFGPYGHATGSVFEILIPLMYGASILPNERWKPLAVAEAVSRWRGTYCITVGTHMYDLLALEPGAEALLQSIRIVASGAGPHNLFDDAERRFGFKVVRGYGLSECLGHVRAHPNDPPEARLRDEGLPFPGVECQIVDPQTGASLPPGEAGEYLCRAPSLFLGYHGQPDLTATVVTPDGFYRTGDLIVRDAVGRLRWAGRLKDVIRRGGLQIDVIEMETMLSEHPLVGEVAVVGEPDARMGERAVAVVVPVAAEDPPDLPRLVEHLARCGLGKESLPERLVLRAALPLTERGKVNRAELRAWLAEHPAVGTPSV
jgi:acyl-CoA synthetase (AMP-forming)/AMP-acid ligase II